MNSKWWAAVPLALALGAAPALGDDHPDLSELAGTLERPDPNRALEHHDQLSGSMGDVVSSGPFAHVTKNLAVAGRGERLLPNATTDVWAFDRYAYIGTFNEPCGDGTAANGSGVRIFDVSNPHKPLEVNAIPSPDGSRANDVKVAVMNAGDILVHTNESCDDGPGGFEVYNVDDPLNPVHLSSVRIDELNPISDVLFGGLSDVGVHNLWLFSQGSRDYVAAVAETAFDNFQIYDITDPANPTLVTAWGAEEIFDPGVGDLSDVSDPGQVNRVLNAALWLLDGFGRSANRFLHDITLNAEGTRAYLSNWDAGLVLLDVSDPANPGLISVALDPGGGSLDGEVNSHNAWPSEDGTVVVETEEDFSAWEAIVPPSNLTFGDVSDNNPGDTGTAPLPGTAVATQTGDDFEANPTGNTVTVTGTSVTVDAGPLAGETFAAVELAGDQPKFDDVGPVTGEAVFVGRLCDSDTPLNAGAVDSGDVAVVRRGACTFREKNFNAAGLGAGAIVIANNLTSTAWGGVRIWDYTDPANPVLASTFNTVCSASTSPSADCDRRGTFSVHNVQVEDDRAYISWYSDGVLILDISDPYFPVETARFNEAGPAFEADNGGIQDVWGIYKIENNPWIFASDRNGGLYVLKEYGSGSGKVAKD